MKYRIKAATQNFVFESEKEVITIGRSRENDFVVPLEDFSRKHCQITIKGDYVFMMDLGSKNGVIIDGERLIPHKQYSIYPKSKVVLANCFELYLQGASTFIDDGKIVLDLKAIRDKKI